MKLDVGVLRYLTSDDFRVLTAVELGMKNHDLVPAELIVSLSGLKPSTAFRGIGTLHKHKLVFHSGQKYDGYRLTYMGYDYLALRAFCARGSVAAVGRRVGVGKESDVYEVIDKNGRELILKLHRLGRVSFRAIKSKRDYMGARKSASWLYMSRLAAIREYSYMQALHKRDFPVPEPIDQCRHGVLMTRAQGAPLYQVRELAHPQKVMQNLMALIVRLASYGLVHGDFNEFNLVIDDDETVTLIDFPQMISTSHPDAVPQFDRDVECVRTYFSRRLNFTTSLAPELYVDTLKRVALDVELSASGHSSEEMKAFDQYLRSVQAVEGEPRNQPEQPAASSSEDDSASDSDASTDAAVGHVSIVPETSAVEEIVDAVGQCSLNVSPPPTAEPVESDSSTADDVQEAVSKPAASVAASTRKTKRASSNGLEEVDMDMIRMRVKSRLQKVAAHRATKTARAARRRKVQARQSLRQRVKIDPF